MFIIEFIFIIRITKTDTFFSHFQLLKPLTQVRMSNGISKEAMTAPAFVVDVEANYYDKFTSSNRSLLNTLTNHHSVMNILPIKLFR